MDKPWCCQMRVVKSIDCTFEKSFLIFSPPPPPHQCLTSGKLSSQMHSIWHLFALCSDWQSPTQLCWKMIRELSLPMVYTACRREVPPQTSMQITRRSTYLSLLNCSCPIQLSGARTGAVVFQKEI